MMRGFCPRGFCPERAHVLMELCMEGVLSEGFLSKGVLSYLQRGGYQLRMVSLDIDQTGRETIITCMPCYLLWGGTCHF